jgi:outer membrane protein
MRGYFHISHRRRRAAALLSAWLMALAGAHPARGADAPPPDYSKGVPPFPKFWRAFEWRPVPAPNLGNSAGLLQRIHDGKLELPVTDLMRLVVENSLDLLAARYNVDIAETDLLRAKSGQAARGAPGVPLPGEIFASALGAGVGGASTGGGGGTGPAAITSSARQVVIGPRGTLDPDVQVTVSYDHASSPLNTRQVAGISTVVTPSTAVVTRFEKAFSTGLSFSVSFNSQRQSSTQQFLLYDPAYTSRLSLSFNQPLLNGFGTAVGRRFINLAKNGVQISRELFRQQISQALVNGQNAYWDLVAARENVESANRAVAAAARLYENDRKQLTIGSMSVLDVTQAEAALAASRRDLVVAQTNQRIRELQLKSLISKNVDALADVELVTTDPLPEPRGTLDIPSYEEAVRTALHNRSELRQAQLGLQNQEINRRFTQNSLKPTLSVFGLYASSALLGAAGPMLQQVWLNMPYPEYAAGMSLTIPLRNRSAQADAIRAELEMSQAKTAMVRTENQVKLDVRTAITALTQAVAQVEAAKAAAESSRAAFEAEQVKLTIGVSTSYLVIQAQRDLVAAESAETVAQANYAKARIQLNRTLGLVIQDSGVSVDEVLGCCR